MLCWNSLPSRRAIVYHRYYYYPREMQTPHPWHSLLASSIWIIHRLLNNWTWQSRCLTLLKHRNKLKTQNTVFRDDLLGSDLSVSHIAFKVPTQPLGAFFSTLAVKRYVWKAHLKTEIMPITTQCHGNCHLQVAFQMWGSGFKLQTKWPTALFGVRSCATW